MRYWLFGILGLTLICTGVMEECLPSHLHWIIYIALGVAFLLLLQLFIGVLKPVQTVSKGLDLLASQDFNNRLITVNEPESDKIVKLFNTMIDKLRNERLKNLERENFLQLLVEASPMGVLMLDFDGKVSMANRSFLKITGINSEAEITGLSVDELPSELARKMSTVPLGGNEVIRRGDIRRYRCYHLSFVQSGFERTFYLLESLTEEMMKAERTAYEKVIRIISHEVNNTMGGVRSVLDMLHEINENEELQEVIESCDNRCEQMTRFISSFAEVVKVPDPVKSVEDLNKVAGDMIPFLQGMGREGVNISYQPAEEELPVALDISLMQQVLVNIVKNAVESIPDKGEIFIRTEKEDGRYKLEISNDGLPITEQVSAQLFSPFFTTKNEGRGIGLTLVSEILNRHGAVYSLQTGSDGITRFTISFAKEMD